MPAADGGFVIATASCYDEMKTWLANRASENWPTVSRYEFDNGFCVEYTRVFPAASKASTS
jgi:hypothetical protein